MSGTGPRFTWDNTSDLILLFSLLSDTKIGSGGWDVASAKLAEKGFLSSDGNPIKASAISQHYTKLRAQIMKLAAESTSTSTGGSPTPVTPKRTRTGRPKQTDEQKAAAKATRQAKKAAGASPIKGGRRGKPGIAKERPFVDNEGGTTKDEEDSDEPMMAKRDGNYAAGTRSKKRRMSSVVKKVEKVGINDPAESAGSAEMDISDGQ